MRGLTQDVELSSRGRSASTGDASSTSIRHGNPGGLFQPDEEPARARSAEARASLHVPSVGDSGGSAPDSLPVIGVICAGDLAVHRDKIKQALQRGLEQNPDAVWVCLEKKSDRMTHDVMISLGMDPVVLPLNDWWRVRGTAPDGTEVFYDGRRTWRDLEMLSLCDELIVFHKAASKTHWRDRATKGARNLHVIDIGKPKKEHTK